MHAAGLDIKLYHKFSQIEQLERNKLKKTSINFDIQYISMKYLSMFASYIKMQIFTDWTIRAEETKETTSSEFAVCDWQCSTLWCSDWLD